MGMVQGKGCEKRTIGKESRIGRRGRRGGGGLEAKYLKGKVKHERLGIKVHAKRKVKEERSRKKG